MVNVALWAWQRCARMRLSTDAELTAFATQHGLGAPAKQARTPAQYKAQLAKELAAKSAKSTAGSAYAAADAKAVQALINKLADPNKIFGTGVKHADGHWGTQVAVTEVSVMQYLERGFIRNDAMPARTGKEKDGKQQVFNADVATTLARFGWSPGATFGDTMHFDFIEGYSLAVPGGRSRENVKETRFSPEGDLPSPVPKPAKAKKPCNRSRPCSLTSTAIGSE